MQGKAGGSRKLTATNSASHPPGGAATLRVGKASKAWRNHNIPPSGKRDGNGVCWGKGEAVSSIGTWKIMKPSNLLSITGIYFNCTSRLEKWELLITEPGANCMPLTTVTHVALEVCHLQPRSLGRVQNSLTFVPTWGATSVLNMQKTHYHFSLNFDLCPSNIDFFNISLNTVSFFRRSNRGKTTEWLTVFPGSVQLKPHLRCCYY